MEWPLTHHIPLLSVFSFLNCTKNVKITQKVLSNLINMHVWLFCYFEETHFFLAANLGSVNLSFFMVCKTFRIVNNGTQVQKMGDRGGVHMADLQIRCHFIAHNSPIYNECQTL